MKANWPRHNTVIVLNDVMKSLRTAIGLIVQAKLNGSLSELEYTDLYKRIDGQRERDIFDLIEFYIEREMQRIVKEIGDE